ncbi:hypothetical protein KR026_008207 [Drosophila bipectinata]|nr:hypothetical protein KR026_008207 [Drosophila bipectinata]
MPRATKKAKEKETAEPVAPKKRLAPSKKSKKTAATAEKENEVSGQDHTQAAIDGSQQAVYALMRHAEHKESMHQKYVKEMQQLYTRMGHEAFLATFIGVLKAVLEAEENNENGNRALNFCAAFVSSFASELTHPMLPETFHWLLTTYSGNPYIRYRMCYFVNLILKVLGPNAALDDTQCDEILDVMLERVKDVSPSVRKQAVLAMQRLQIPDNPSDPVVCAYVYHLSSDPSPSVRQCIITCMGRNYITVPHILQRLWDVDEKVRRHTYLNMCNYPVRSYKVAQRLTLLEQGLNESSANVRKTVINFMLKAWIESYQQNYIQLTAALKLDSNEEELLRFRRVAKQMLRVIFEQTDIDQLVALLPLSDDCELHRCIPHESLNVELLLYWQCLSDYLETVPQETDPVLPELSVFCTYVEKFCQFQKPDMDKFAQVEFQNMLLSLVEILQSYDLGDEIGRENLRKLIQTLLKDCLLDHKIVAVLVRCMEQLETDMNDRMQFFIEIIYDLCELNTKQNELVHDRNLINKLLDDLDTPLKMRITALKVRILELEEQEDTFVRQKEYIRAQAVTEEKAIATEDYTELIRPLLERHGGLEMPARPKLSKQDRVLKGLYVSYYMVASPHVTALTPSICQLYKDFICRYLHSTEVDIFEWAIKCGTSYSMFYEAYAKEVFEVVVEQFCNNNVVRLCETAANCMLEMLDHHGLEYFSEFNQGNGGGNTSHLSKSKRRQLYNIDLYDDDDDGSTSQTNEQTTDIIVVMCHYMERVQNKGVGVAIARGLCRLVLRGHLDDRPEVLELLLKRYFNPNTEPIISQVLGMFFEQLVARKQQQLLQPCLLNTLWLIMNCSFDSPLNGVQPDHVTKFFIDLTLQESSTPQTNIHNKIALSFLHYIHNYFTERKEMCRLLAKELTNLKVNVFNGPDIKSEMLEMADKLIANELEPRMTKNFEDFKLMVNGSFNPPARKNPEDGDSDDDCDTATVTTLQSETVVPAPAPATEPADPNLEESSTEATLTNSNKDTTTQESEETAQVAAPAAQAAAETPTPAAEPIITTFGRDNIVGLRYLRRSLAASQSEVEGILGEQASEPEKEPEAEAQKEKTPEAQAVQTSKRNLRRPQMQRRLERAMARSSKTPEKTLEPQDSEAETIPESPVRAEKVRDCNCNQDVARILTFYHLKSNYSEVIDASPVAASPNATSAPNASHVRLRTLRNRKAPGASTSTSQTTTTATAASKRKVLALETPMRNGRKRILRRTSSDHHSRSFQTTGSPASSSPRNSPLRKQQRLDERSSRRERLVQNTNSPTESTSSVKENRVPPKAAETESESDKESEAEEPVAKPKSTKSKQPANKTLSSVRTMPSSSTPKASPKVTTRNAARAQRINSMCMTRKRMSLEMNLSGGQLQVSTPKRVTRAVVASTSLSGSADRTRGRRKAV